jgi:glycosyltransferase involved in cell wall biosynthesis
VTGERGGKPYLSIVIPAYNEEERLGDSLQRVAEYVDGAWIDAELLVVDDGSTDDTGRLAASVLHGRRGRVLTNRENRGKGHAVRRGVLEAAGSWVLMTDADLSSPIEDHAKLAQAARDHDLDVAFGSRALPDSDVEIRQHVVRETMGKTFNVLMRAMTGLRHRDTQCGFKLMDRRRTRPLFERMVIDRFAFDVELLFLCERFGLSVREIPVVWRNAPGSRVSILADPLNMLWDVARVRWRFRRGLYNPDVEPSADAGV